MPEDRLSLVGDLLTVSAKEAGALGFMAQPLVQVTLPHRDPGNVPVFARSAGNTRLIIQPLMDDKDGKIINYGIPYGTIPRLVLAWLSTEVVKTKSQHIPLGDSLSMFMRELEMVPTGGRWGTVTRLKDQVERLFSSTFSLVRDDGKVRNTGGFKLAHHARFFWDRLNPQQQSLFGSFVVLSTDFYNEIIQHPVPLDMRILRALRTSPFAIDLYTWLTYRVSYLKRETVIPWESLKEQFGCDYSQLKTFKFNLIKNLNKILPLYPVKVRPGARGLALAPSPPSIPKKALSTIPC